MHTVPYGFVAHPHASRNAPFPWIRAPYIASARDLGEILSAAEFFDHASLELVLRHIPDTRSPLPPAPLYMVIETAGSVAQHDGDKVDRFLAGLLEEALVEDGTVAQDGVQAQGIWRLRESISEALRHAGAVYKYDLSLPTADMYRCVG